MGQKTERAFKSMLEMSGYSARTAHEVWNWYNCPTEKSGNIEDERAHDPKEFGKRKINNPADNTLVRTRNH